MPVWSKHDLYPHESFFLSEGNLTGKGKQFQGSLLLWINALKKL